MPDDVFEAFLHPDPKAKRALQELKARLSDAPREETAADIRARLQEVGVLLRES